MPNLKVPKIDLVAAIGFAGRVKDGLISHPDGKHLIYPLGSTIVVKNMETGRQFFLHGHTDTVTCVALSNSGRMIASGQKTHMGFKADVLLWDFEKAKEDSSTALIRKLPELHKVKIQSLAFSPKDSYLATLGGTDCNTLVVWNVNNGRAISYAQAASESAKCVRFVNNSESQLVTGGHYHLRRWNFCPEKTGLTPTDVNLGTLRRIFNCIAISDCDRYCYAGTSSGDLLLIDLLPEIPAFKKAGNEMFGKGILSICYLTAIDGSKEVAIGNGDGTIVRLDSKTLKKKPNGMYKVLGGVTGMAPVRKTFQDPANKFYFGTDESNIYTCKNFSDLCEKNVVLKASCHYEGINDVAFMPGFDTVFVTCSQHDIRIWNAKKQQELLRIQVPNVVCTCVTLPTNGKLIITGWDDGKIRAFKPVSGKLAFVINDAHPNGVTSIAVTNDCNRIVSGGVGGQVRFWSMSTRKMEHSLKEHKASVNSICISQDDKSCVSSSSDGSCIMWDLNRGVRTQAMFASTMFRQMLYHPDESQLLTCGSDRKLTYWDAYDGSTIRIIDGSNHEINALDIDSQGYKFVSGGNDCLVKVFDYDEGEVNAIGEGHSGAIKAIKISSDQEQIVSVGQEGAVFVWKYPYGGDEYQRSFEEKISK